ncbi:MAG: HNH endonuclease signature motif containing protein [Caldilineaceae bacterium]
MAISVALRARIAERAQNRCEYCRLHQDHSIKSHQCDHIIPRKHGGDDVDENLAWACFLCNSSKGSEVAAYDPKTGQLIPLFNPRLHEWAAHFFVEAGLIVARTAIGRVTILVLQLNRPDRVETRQILLNAGLYP